MSESKQDRKVYSYGASRMMSETSGRVPYTETDTYNKVDTLFSSEAKYTTKMMNETSGRVNPFPPETSSKKAVKQETTPLKNKEEENNEDCSSKCSFF